MGWVNKLKARRKYRQYRDGYEFAAGALVYGDETPKTLSRYLLEAKAFGTISYFDRGVEDAMSKLISLGAITDDRE